MSCGLDMRTENAPMGRISCYFMKCSCVSYYSVGINNISSYAGLEDLLWWLAACSGCK